MNRFGFSACLVLLLFFIHDIHCKGCAEYTVGLTRQEQFPDHYFTASSAYSKTTLPHLSRLNSKTAWQPVTNDNQHDYLQVDVGVDYQVCAIATKGSGKHLQWSTKYTITYSIDNQHWTDYQENGKRKIFNGNKDKNTIRKHVLLSKPILRFVRIYPVSYASWKAIRLELYGVYIDNCKKPLGLENYGIDNSQITTFSMNKFKKPTSSAQSCRLHRQSSWKPLKHDEYLQLDLEQKKLVKGIATQGDAQHSIWVTSFTLEFKSVGGSWYEYTPSPDTECFKGNINNNGIVVHWFDIQHHVRYVRFKPKTWHKQIAVRMELYGCEETCDNQPIGLHGSTDIINDGMSASSSKSNVFSANHRRLHHTGGTSSGCWSHNKTFLQVDLGAPYLLCAVATQGNSSADHWVESYNLQTSLDGKVWQYHKQQGGRPKLLVGSSINEHILDPTPLARYLRFLAVKYFGRRCMTIELYGITHHACSKSIVGASVTGQLPYYRFTSSSYKSTYRGAAMGRLFGPSCWTPKTDNVNDHLQIDLGDPFTVCGIASQGCDDQSAVLSYEMAYSMDGQTWTFYQRNGNKIVFEGNQDKSKILKKHIITDHISAKFVRVYPLTYVDHKSLRIEIYGTRQAWRGSLGVEVQYGISHVTDKQLSAASHDPLRTEAQGRLYGPLSWCTTRHHNSYFEIDLQNPREVIGIATQGDPVDADNYIQEYDVQYSYTSDRWMLIPALQGNVDSTSVRVQWFMQSVGARYVRVVPTKWHGMICLRIDIYGNYRVPAPEIISKKVFGRLMPIASSHVIVQCVAYADPMMQLKWFITGHDVTNRSRGQIYSRGQLISTLQVNFTSPSDMVRRYPCVSHDDVTVVCTITLTCRGKSKDAWSDHVVNKITIQISKDDFTSTPPPFTTQLPLQTTLTSLPDSQNVVTPPNCSLSLGAFHSLVTCLFDVFAILVLM